MQKKWMLAIASIALVASACGPNTYGTRSYGTTYTKNYNKSSLDRGYGTTYDGSRYNRTGNIGINGLSNLYGTDQIDGIYGRNRTRSFSGTTGINRNTGYDDFTAYDSRGMSGTMSMSGGYSNYGGMGTSGYPYSGSHITRGAGLYSHPGTAPLNYYKMHGSSYDQFNTATAHHAHSIGYSTKQGRVQQNGKTIINANHVKPLVYVDREALADAVSQVVSTVPGIQHASALVTDKEVLVGVKGTDKDSRSQAAKARANALSITPRYYKVYLSHDPALVQELNHLGATMKKSTTASMKKDHTMHSTEVDNLVRKFGGTTQTEKINSMKSKSQNMHR
ncbi:YhcN/YlaJ family sporulation lipoprotein [Brevibacillus daliensis]|uniref:YhcN/YlaJ family sporulation lipoprotein n=1 Tax=Brevibacillus daliensis TaxID=2892995 RepID=UPI001E3EB49D|nr:YhcN/YlaJ family sporulation lipoprotein [Brevibacillus daliensis]